MTLRNRKKASAHSGFGAFVAVALIVVCTTSEASAEKALAGNAAFKAYCDGLERYSELVKDADDRFGISSSDEKLAWIKQGDEEIARTLSERASLPAVDVFALASDEGWDQQCAAN